MAKVAKSGSRDTTPSKLRPAITPEARESQLIALATNLAEEQLLNGTASSQVITHFLKLGTERERLEREKLQKEKELLEAKVETLQSMQHQEELYANAIEAMRRYTSSGLNDSDL